MVLEDTIEFVWGGVCTGIFVSNLQLQLRLGYSLFGAVTITPLQLSIKKKKLMLNVESRIINPTKGNALNYKAGTRLLKDSVHNNHNT